MAVYNSLTDRDDASALMPEDVSREILKEVPAASVVAQLARRLPNLSRKQRRIPVAASLPFAYFVNGDTGQKQTTEASWENVFLTAEEIAVIAPIPDAVLDDADYPIWDEIRPELVAAIGATFDRAVLHGDNAPSDWPDDLLGQIASADQVVTVGDVGDVFDDIMGEGGVLSKVEEDGYFVNGHLATLAMRAKLRGLRDSNGQPLFVNSIRDVGSYTLDGENLVFARNGSLTAAEAFLISGDWSKLVWAVRQDITWKLLDQAVITDGSGNIVYNLAQQDMVALRVVFRAGWALPNPPNRVNSDDDTRFPFASLEPVSAS